MLRLIVKMMREFSKLGNTARKLCTGLDGFKVALYVDQYNTDNGTNQDHTNTQLSKSCGVTV